MNGDLPTAEGVVRVPVMRFDLGKHAVPTEETVFAPASLLAGRQRLLAVQIVSSGIAPWVLPGAMVLYDPDIDPREDEAVVVAYHGAAVACVHVSLDGRSRFYNRDGSWLDADETTYHGVLVKVLSDPPDPEVLRHSLGR